GRADASSLQLLAPQSRAALQMLLRRFRIRQPCSHRRQREPYRPIQELGGYCPAASQFRQGGGSTASPAVAGYRSLLLPAGTIPGADAVRLELPARFVP